MKRKLKNNLLILLMLAVSLCQNKVYAAENVMVPVKNDEYVSVVLPMIEESDSFNFFIDPLQIFYNTFGNSDEDIAIEEDTHLLFYHRDESEYTLSSRSDCLKIINKSTVPVEVTIKAKLESTEGVSVMQNEVFEDRNSCDLYLALVDNEGNKQPLSEKDEVSVTVKLDRAPLDAYAYTLCEDTGEYEYVCQVEDVDFDTYSFGLTGACNEKGDWTRIKGKTHVTISWNVEPVISDDSESEEEAEALEEDEVPIDEDEAPTDEDKTLVDEDKVLVDEDKVLMDEDKVPVGKDEDSGENADVNTESPVSENGVLNDEEAVKESASDTNHSSIIKEEESGNDSSADESAVTENVKDESDAFEEEQTQEFNKPDEKEEDMNHSGAVKEETSDNDSSAGESAATEDVKDESSTEEKVKDESAAFEEKPAQEFNKPDEKEEDTDRSEAAKEEEPDNDSSTGETAAVKDVKDKSDVFEEKPTQKLNKTDEKTEDTNTFTTTVDKNNLSEQER